MNEINGIFLSIIYYNDDSIFYLLLIPDLTKSTYLLNIYFLSQANSKTLDFNSWHPSLSVLWCHENLGLLHYFIVGRGIFSHFSR